MEITRQCPHCGGNMEAETDWASKYWKNADGEGAPMVFLRCHACRVQTPRLLATQDDDDTITSVVNALITYWNFQQETQMVEPLRPCPKCGGEAELISETSCIAQDYCPIPDDAYLDPDGEDELGGLYVQCKKCGFSTCPEIADNEGAHKIVRFLWNHRAAGEITGEKEGATWLDPKSN